MAKCVGCGLEVVNGILQVDTCSGGGVACATAALPAPGGCTSGLYLSFRDDAGAPVVGDPNNVLGCGLTSDADGKMDVRLCSNGGIKCATAAAPSPGGCVDGIYVSLCTNGGIVVDATGCLKIEFPPSVPGGPASILPLGSCLQTDADGKVNIRLDTTPTGCNALQCNAEGLFVACIHGLHSISQADFKAGVTAPVAVNNAGLGTFNFEANKNWQICNTGCCDMQAMVIIETGGLAIDMNPGFLGRLTFEQSFDNGATWGGIFPEHVQWLDNRNHAAANPNGGVKRESFNLWHETFWNVINTGTCFTYTARMHLTVSNGTGTVSNFGAGAGIELHYHASPVACDPCKNPGDGPATTPFDTSKNMSYVPR